MLVRSCRLLFHPRESIPWEDICGPSSGHDPRIFLSLFDTMLSLSKQVNEKFQKTADDKMMMSSALPRWRDVYCLGDMPDYHKAPQLNESFSHLLDKPVASCRHVALSIEDIAKLETCVWGLVESQSFSFWSIATMFEFLKHSYCVPQDLVFRQVIASMTTTVTSQVKASFLLAVFLQ